MNDPLEPLWVLSEDNTVWQSVHFERILSLEEHALYRQKLEKIPFFLLAKPPFSDSTISLDVVFQKEQTIPHLCLESRFLVTAKKMQREVVMGSDIFDLVIILILVFSTFLGGRHGLIREVTGIVGILGGFSAANALQPKLSEYLTFINNPTARYLLAYTAIFAAVMLLVAIIARLLLKFRDFTMTRRIDLLAGALFGLAKGLFACSLILYVIQSLFADAPFIQNSRTLVYLNHIIAQIRAWIPDDLMARIDMLSK